MRLSVARVRGIGFILWHARHMFYHMLMGVAWAWFLREQWHQFSDKWLFLAILGSVLPDSEHLFYLFSYGKKDPYTKAIKQFLRYHEWRLVTVFIETGHKYNTNLKFHNVYIIGILLIFATICSFYDWNSWVVLLGAMVIHYVFDIFDDIITLGRVNSNWRRWGSGKLNFKSKSG